MFSYSSNAGILDNLREMGSGVSPKGTPDGTPLAHGGLYETSALHRAMVIKRLIYLMTAAICSSSLRVEATSSRRVMTFACAFFSATSIVFIMSRFSPGSMMSFIQALRNSTIAY